MKIGFLLLFFWAFTHLPVLAQADEAWVATYNGLGNDVDEASAVAVDDSGNVYVAGTSYGGGTTYDDYTTVKYAPNGDTVWVRRYNGPLSDYDEVWDLAVDNSGNVYVTGRSPGTGFEQDFATIKYAPNGDTVWVRRYDGPVNGYDAGSALAVDDSGNVYVTGYGAGNGTSFDYTTIKYWPNGDTVWVRRYNGPGNDDDLAWALAIDDSGYIYITGESRGSGTDFDYATIKYKPNGDTVWVRRYNCPTGYDIDKALALAVDDSGNVYVTGYSYDSVSSSDYATIKYKPNGDTAWVRRYGGSENYDDQARALAIDNSGYLYVTGGTLEIDGNGFDYATIKYAPNGAVVWVRRYNGPGSSDDYANALAIDNSGNLHVTGTSSGIGTFDDCATIKYKPNGDTVWVARYNGAGNNHDVANAVAVDDSGNVYVTGYSTDSSFNVDFATIKYVQSSSCCVGIRGDYDGDGDDADILDLTFLINDIYRGGPPAACPLEADVDGNGTPSNVLDLTLLINRIFRGGPAPMTCT